MTASPMREDGISLSPASSERSILSAACSITSTGTGRFEQAFFKPDRILARSNGSRRPSVLATMGVDPARVAVERNQDVVPRRSWTEARLSDGDQIEVVAFVGGGSHPEPAIAGGDDPLVIAGKTFHSRLLVGTGKYRTLEE